MNKLKTPIAIFLAWNVMIFLTIGFINWEINPSKWTSECRGITSMIGILFGSMFASFSFTDKSN